MRQWSRMPKFYVTTPIFYLNAKPHIGTAYPAVAADVMARWHRLKGDDTFFLTGTDEHGEKVERKAIESGLSPQEHVDRLSMQFKEVWKQLSISYDDFIRTTEKRHEDSVRHFIKLMQESGDIYKGVYEDWYCTPDETFITETQLIEGRCPSCGREVKKLKEETYFFRLSKYQDRLLEHYKSNPDFILPKSRANEVINRVREGLKDISITRSTVKWGIPFPFDGRQTVYVWADALVNYLSALGWPDSEPKYWPADVHIVGKDINWFHSAIWPAMLFSAGLKLPKTIYVTGHWLVDGVKMSKSLGNATDPAELAERYSVDAFRYFLLREMPLGDDGNFSERQLRERTNNELAADLGNLVYRVLTLAEGFKGELKGEPVLESSFEIKPFTDAMDSYNTFKALEILWKSVKASNKYINDTKPWALDGELLGSALYNMLEAVRIIAILIYPFMPNASESICEQLGTRLGRLEDCTFKEADYSPKRGKLLFNKIE